jgi:protein-disulfide isomerase
LWTAFLTPLAVLAGAVLVAGAIWMTDDDDSPEPTSDAVAEVAGGAPGDNTDVAGAASTATGGNASTVQSAVDIFASYATEVGLDEDEFRQCYAESAQSTSPAVQTINAHLQEGVDVGVNATPSFAINNKFLVGAQPPEIFEEVIDAELSDSPPTSIDQYSPAIQQLAQAGRFSILDAPVSLEGAAISGNPDAKVVVAEFSDFQCPFCRRWEQEYGEQLRQRGNGDIALAFLHFPLQQIHPNAPFASVAAICAQQGDKFWEMHDLLFARQDEWAEAPSR